MILTQVDDDDNDDDDKSHLLPQHRFEKDESIYKIILL